MCGIAALFAYHGSAPEVSPDELIAIRESHDLAWSGRGRGVALLRSPGRFRASAIVDHRSLARGSPADVQGAMVERDAPSSRL